MTANKHETEPQELVVAVQSVHYEQPPKTLFEVTPATQSANERNDHPAFQIVASATHL